MARQSSKQKQRLAEQPVEEAAQTSSELIKSEQPVQVADEPSPLAKDSAPALLDSHRGRRYLARAILAGVALLVALPIGMWLQYQSSHVMSRNAMVRGQLAEIGTRLDGVLFKIEVQEGEQVVAGQILGRLDDRHIRSNAQEVAAELQGLERELEVERSSIEYEKRMLANKLREADANLKAAEAEVAVAQSQADDARQYFEVRQQLLTRHAISREDVRDADTKRKTAFAELNVAKANLIAAQSAEQTVHLEADGLTIRQQRLGVFEANVARARARLAGAQADIDGALIRAPADGAVVRWLVQPGGSVEVGKPVMSMWVGAQLWVEAWIDEDEISKIQMGSKAVVTLQSFPGREFDGLVDKIGLTTDFQMPEPDIPQPRFVRMRGAPVVGVLVKLRDPPQHLLPGLSAVVAIRNQGS